MLEIKQYKTALDVLNGICKKDDPHHYREKQVKAYLRDGIGHADDTIVAKEGSGHHYNKLWCYEILQSAGTFKKAAIALPGYSFYDGAYWKQLGINEMWCYEIDPDIRWVNMRLLKYILDDIEIKGKTCDPIIDHRFLTRDVDLAIYFECERMANLNTVIYDGFYTNKPVLVFQGGWEKKRGYINLCETLEDFKKTLPKLDIMHEETRNEKHMVIGCLE